MVGKGRGRSYIPKNVGMTVGGGGVARRSYIPKNVGVTMGWGRRGGMFLHSQECRNDDGVGEAWRGRGEMWFWS